MRTIQLFLKRGMDFLVSLFCTVLLLPIFALISLFIVLESKGSPVFKQERIGKDGKIFKVYKFRTMVQNAEKLGNGLFVYDETDTRITKVGKILRKTSLDELPQLFNVLKGEMSIIGPRPPVVYHPYDGYDNYPKEYQKRFSMRPGITGLAQVRLRNSAGWDERIKLDIQYVEKYNILMDIKIFFQTFFAMLYSETYTE